MASRDLTADEVTKKIREEEERYDDPNSDGNTDPVNIGDQWKKVMGDELQPNQTLVEQIEGDEKKRGDIAPDGSDAQEDEE